MFDLARTVWPRFGGDRANRSLLSVPGPHASPTWQKISLSAFQAMHSPDAAPSGVIVMPDETLRVCHAGMLFAVMLDGTILWHLDLSQFIVEGARRTPSLPTALQSGETLLHLRNSLLTIDRHGSVCRRDYLIDPHSLEFSVDPEVSDGSKKVNILPDDSGFSLNITYSGLPIISAITGEVYVFKENVWQRVGPYLYGYDILTPAVYPDNSLAIAGYYGKGFCRVSLDGEMQWTTQLMYADLLPTLNIEYVAAVGSSNDHLSAFFKPDGVQIGEYPYAATFAVYPDGGWIARSERRLARLTLEGKELWGCEIDERGSMFSVDPPIVDCEGFVFVHQKEGFLCFDAHGQKAFEVKLSVDRHGFMSIIAPSMMAYVSENELFIGYS